MNQKPILYNLEPIDLAGHRFKVTMTITDPDPRGQRVALPAWIPGSYLIRDFARQIETIEARCGRKPVLLKKLDNHTWRADPCQSTLVITTIVYAWDLSVRSAHLDESHGFVNGTSVFLRAIGQENQPCLLDVSPPSAQAKDWKVYTSMPLAKARKSIKTSAIRSGFTRYEVANYDALVDHPIEMGSPLAARFKACGAEHELIFTGLIPNLDLQRITTDVRKICEAQIRFFDPYDQRAPFLDSATKYVFMTMVVGDGYGGLEHRASTALIASRKDLPTIGQSKAPAGYETFLGLISHEYFHTWHVKRIKPSAFAPYDLSRENHTRLLWIFEGFTSYYDDLMLLRSNVITKDAYLKLLAKQISTVWANTGRHKQSVAESSFDAWTRYYKQDENSPNAIVSYYTKGAIIALGLDLTIRNQSDNKHSLDDVMRLLWKRYGLDFYRGAQTGITENSFIKIVREATGVDVGDEVSRWAYGTDDVELKELLATQGIDLDWREPSQTPTMGVRTRKQADQLVLANVYEGQAAHKGGLSAQDVFVAIDGLRVEATPGALENILSGYKSGDQVEVHVFRRDELRAFYITLEKPMPSDCVLTIAGAQNNA